MLPTVAMWNFQGMHRIYEGKNAELQGCWLQGFGLSALVACESSVITFAVASSFLLSR